MVNRKELNPESSPRAAFGALVRSSREERGWTQDELADATEYSSTHISAIETSRKPPTLRFSRSIDRALGTGDQFERKYREVKQGVLLEGFPEYVGYEGRAVEIRLFEIGLIPGLLQTPKYARALAEGDVQRGSINAEQAAQRVAFLAERQSALTRTRPPMVLVVMDESCLRHRVGGSEVMEEQLQRLEEVAARPNWVLQVSPFEIGARRSFNLPVNLLTLADRSVVAYAESQAQGYVERETGAVVPMLTAYHQLQAEALSQAASVALINQLRKGIP
ncbi:helix-turn-helix domain-containing protein [Streptomyces albidoflavus]|uniref:helix-turn-helix domain-containing protein n=1 Tax=Streptomyces albidoflavus TaxID=1886 RepID=UPI00101E248C|nr:helix-turn-helix transcriptional regulator [Streptomyces albidoflavus]RZD80851.1 transcriptional regulator [Streptomyces albidoflavus]RZD98421.1 transcriptional regulator [Streptomyces albidoflavus]RZE01729.1 transcriptional regulator [Streptomyces albidoflavus]RZE03168.1 transcriptional regulator [Streptomyces albidoflavus]